MLPPLFETANDYGVDPLDVLFSLVEVQNEERTALEQIIEARQKARITTGLTLKRLWAWEDSGKDCITWRCPNGIGLDVVARELAGMYPALGIGEGYGAGVDVDYAEPLWAVLRQPDPVIRDACSLLSEAAARVVAAKGSSHAIPF